MNPYEPPRVSQVVQHERPDLWEQWNDQGTLVAHLNRLIRNATWLLEQHLAELDSSASTSTLRQLRDSSQLEMFALEQAIWLSTPEDDMAESTALDKVIGASQRTSLPSDWFSIS